MDGLYAKGRLRLLDITGVVEVWAEQLPDHVFCYTENEEFYKILENAIYISPLSLGNKKAKRDTLDAVLAAVQVYIEDPKIQIQGDWLVPLENEPGRIY